MERISEKIIYGKDLEEKSFIDFEKLPIQKINMFCSKSIAF